MHALVGKLTNQHEMLLDSLDESLQPFAEIRDKNLPAPPNPEQIARPLLRWMQREFLPHLVEEEDLFRPYFMPTEEGEALFASIGGEHAKLRKLLRQAREEINLLLGKASIRQAWWDTVDLSTLWAFRRALSEHIEFEHRHVFPKVIALDVNAPSPGREPGAAPAG